MPEEALLQDATGAAPASSSPRGVRPAALLLTIAVGVAIWLLHPADIEPRAWRLLALFVATIVGIIIKPLPMGAMSILGIAVALITHTLTLDEALSGFANGTVWLVLAAFLISAAFIKSGLGERIAYHLISTFGRSTLGLGYSLAATDLVLAPAIASNTARAGGVVFPILKTICRTVLDADPVRGQRTNAFLTLTAYHANCITSAMFLTASGANPLIRDFANTTKPEEIAISWTLWAWASVVPGLVTLVAAPLMIRRLVPPGAQDTTEVPRLARARLLAMGAVRRDEWWTATIAVALLTTWIYGPFKDDNTTPALAALALLLLVGVLTWNDVLRDHEAWNTFIWFATLTMMATKLAALGVVGWFSGHVGSVFQGVGWMPGLVGLALVYFYSHYLFASTSAHVTAMYAPFLVVALGLGAPALLAVFVLASFSSLMAILTHYGGAAAPILFSGGYVPTALWWRVGLIVSMVVIVLWLAIGGAWWKAIGFW